MQTQNPRLWFFLLIMTAPFMPAQAETTSLEPVSTYSFNKDKPVVPTEALVLRAGIPGVFVAQENQARFRMVRAGKSQNRFTAILSGLINNDAVIRDPRTLFDGQNIKVAQ